MPFPSKRPLETGFKNLLDLVTVANKYDRFKLLNDPSALASDLDNPIHHLLRSSNFEYGNDFSSGDFIYEKMGQALQLSSMFLQHDSVLEWFVAPLMGRSLQSLHPDGRSKQTYLSNPLANTSQTQKKALINEVRKALHCLSNCITFRFLDEDPNSYARTLTDKETPPHEHTSACTKYFTSKHSVRIEIRPQYSKFFLNEYEESSRCKQFRHDFSFATVLVHEICHAVGVMRRGNMIEPYLRCDHPKAELGHAWENYMFGAVINPFDQASDSIGFLMRRIWSDNVVAKAAGGKQWAAVPVSYVAKWFRKDTWDIIADGGPTDLALPHVELKIISTTNSHHYAVYSDSREKLRYIQAYKHVKSELYPRLYAANTLTLSDFHGAFVDLHVIGTEELQKTSLTAPTRTPRPMPSYGLRKSNLKVGVRTEISTPSSSSSNSVSASIVFDAPNTANSPSEQYHGSVLDTPLSIISPHLGNPLKRRGGSGSIVSQRVKMTKLYR